MPDNSWCQTDNKRMEISPGVFLSQQAQRSISTDVVQRQQIEACGVLLGHIDEQGSWHIEQVHPLPNIFNSPVYFEFAPEDLLTMDLLYPGQIVGVYHSHPTGFAHASNTDKENMQRVNLEEQIPWIWLIIRGPFDATFVQKAQVGLPEEVLIAYHHYAGGLKRVPIELA